MNARIADLIREGRADEITDAVAEGEFFQMQTFTQALIEHVLSGQVDARGRGERGDEPPRLPRLARAGASSGSAPPTATLPTHRWPQRPPQARARGRRGADAPAGRAGRGPRPPHRPGGLARAPPRAPRVAARRRARRGHRARRHLRRRARATPFTRAEPRRRTPSLSVPGVALDAARGAGAALVSASFSALWQHAGAAYGIPWQVLAAINKVESNFGRNMGPSSAGAIGWMQFMPSTWLRWGVDANGDGVADPWNPTDAIFSAARYLAAAGGTTDLYRGVYAYNHADWYVHEVLVARRPLRRRQHASRSRSTGMQQSLDAARRDVVARGRRSSSLRRQVVRREARVVARWQTRAPTRRALLSDRLALEQRAGHAARPPRRGERAGRSAAERARRAQQAARARAAGVGGRVVRPGRGAAPRRARRTRAATSSRSAAAPASCPPRTPTTTIRPSTSRRRSGSPLYALANAVVVRVVERARPALRHRLHAPGVRRPGLDVLPPLGARPGRRPRRHAHRRRAGRPRRRDRARDRPAPPPPAPAGDRLAAAGGLVPVVRRHGLQLVGRGDRERRAQPARSPSWLAAAAGAPAGPGLPGRSGPGSTPRRSCISAAGS